MTGLEEEWRAHGDAYFVLFAFGNIPPTTQTRAGERVSVHSDHDERTAIFSLGPFEAAHTAAKLWNGSILLRCEQVRVAASRCHNY